MQNPYGDEKCIYNFNWRAYKPLINISINNMTYSADDNTDARSAFEERLCFLISFYKYTLTHAEGRSNVSIH